MYIYIYIYIVGYEESEFADENVQILKGNMTKTNFSIPSKHNSPDHGVTFSKVSKRASKVVKSYPNDACLDLAHLGHVVDDLSLSFEVAALDPGLDSPTNSLFFYLYIYIV